MSHHGQGHQGQGAPGGQRHSVVVPVFGYYDQTFPCTNDTETCHYKIALYVGHLESMMFTGLLWVTFILIFVFWAIFRHAGQPKDPKQAWVGGQSRPEGTLVRLRRTGGAFFRRGLLQDALRPIFGRATRLQVLVLALLSAYLILWSFIGLIYGKWVAPVQGKPGATNTYTSLAPWANRVGIFAYALTPFLILLGSRESLLSLMSGIPYQSFNFLHRWVGYVIFAQAILHTVGWVIAEAGLHGQPQTSNDWIRQKYMIWGCAAMGLLTLMVALSSSWGIRLTGYEFFRKSHYLLGILYFASCVLHWEKLEIFMAPSLILWIVDRVIRLVRSALIHFQRLPSGKMGFKAGQGVITTFPDPVHGDIIRLDFENRQKAWPVGKHFYLCFTELSIWQSHPFTPLNAPVSQEGVVKHSYIMRVRKGATLKLARLAERKALLARANPTTPRTLAQITTPVVVTGPYGEMFMKGVTMDTNIVCVAGGTGITAMLSVLLHLAQSTPSPDRKVELIWAMRHSDNVKWVQEELDSLRRVQKDINLTIRLYATRDADISAPSIADSYDNKQQEIIALEEFGSSSSRDVPTPCGSLAELPIRRAGYDAGASDRRPDLGRLINDFLASTLRGSTTVFASGPGGMASDLGTIVAAQNSAGKVWRNEQRYAVRLVCDDRLER